MKKGFKAFTAFLLALCMIALPVITACDKQESAETGESSGTTTAAATETVQTETETEAYVAPVTPNHENILTKGDQTGHPENSAETVDVDALLTKNDSYDTKEDYKVRFKTSGNSSKDKSAQVGLIKTDYPTATNIVAAVNVRTYGAMGNGLHDDTAAFTQAVTACSQKGGGVVFVPAGYYCLTKTIHLPQGVGLVGELEEGTVNGTVLCIYGGKGKTSTSQAAVSMTHHTAVRNIAFWYPEQTIVNGMAIPYPATLVQTGSEGVTVQNVTFVNAYFCIDYAHGGSNNSLQYTRNVYGTPLFVGYENDKSFDIGKVENMNFSPSYWLNSGLPGTPNEALLREYLLRYATGMIIERIDWTYYADVTVEGYNIGVHARKSADGVANGSMYHFNLLGCKTCFYAQALNWMIVTDCVFTAVGDETALAVSIPKGCSGNMTFNTCKLTSEGTSAVLNKGSMIVTLSDCEVSAKGEEPLDSVSKRLKVLNTTITPTTKKEIITDEKLPALTRADYDRTVVCKPKSDAFVDLSKEPYKARTNTDVTEKLQEAIDSLKETGGTVYIPGGSYTLKNHIDVWAGIELRGAQYWPQNGGGVTYFKTSYGEKDAKGEALFTLYEGAGMVGLGVNYPNLDKAKNPYSFIIRGNGAGIYLIDLTLPSTYNGVDFSTYRCDNHYIEYIHAAVLNVGIQVGGGSENGIIRDCHFTPNTFAYRSSGSWWNDVYSMLNRQGKTFVVNESKNEIVYHNFTYGAGQGLSITDGAQNVYVLCHGVDAGNVGAYITGNSTSTLVNCQLVNLNGTSNILVNCDKNFTGETNIFNYAGWGAPNRAFVLRGTGTARVIGGITTSSCNPFFDISTGNAEVYATIYSFNNTALAVGTKCKSLNASGNFFTYKKAIKVAGSSAVVTGKDTET